MHSTVDWFAFGLWSGGSLSRSLSVSPASGVMENIGRPLDFEEPYWSGDFPQPDYPLPFHPLELGETALRELLGFNYEGHQFDDDPELEKIPLAGFRPR